MLETAKHGFRSYGVELNIWLVLYARYQAWKHGLAGATFKRKDLWKVQRDLNRLSYREMCHDGHVDNKVPNSNSAGGKSLAHDCMALHCTEPFIITFPLY